MLKAIAGAPPEREVGLCVKLLMHGASAPRKPERRHAALQIPAVLAALAVLHGIWQWARSRKRVFLLDFACYKPPDDLKVSYEGFITGLANAKVSAQLLPSSVSP